MELLSKQLVLCLPHAGGANPNNAAGQPPACIAMQQAAGVPPLPQVVHVLVKHHGSPEHRQPPEQRRLRLLQGADSSLLRQKVAKISWVTGVIHIMGVVVAPGGVTPPAQVSILMDVDSSGFWRALFGEATEAEEDLEFPLRLLFEQDLTVDFGGALLGE